MLKIRGYSDDVVVANVGLQTKCSKCGQEIEEPEDAVVVEKDDEIGYSENGVCFRVGSKEDGGVSVKMIYAPGEGACWAALIHQLEEDIPIPWPVRIRAEGYTVIVEVEAPNGTPVKVSRSHAYKPA